MVQLFVRLLVNALAPKQRRAVGYKVYGGMASLERHLHDARDLADLERRLRDYGLLSS